VDGQSLGRSVARCLLLVARWLKAGLAGACPTCPTCLTRPTCPACPPCPTGPLRSRSTQTFRETPESVGDASARSTPSTTANASSSSGMRRPSASAVARCVRASSSNPMRSGGRHARCHSTADSNAPPAKKPIATKEARGPGRHRTTVVTAPPTLAKSRRKPRTNGGSGRSRPATAPTRRPAAGTAATARTRRRGAKAHPLTHHKGRKGHKGQTVKDFLRVLGALCGDRSEARLQILPSVTLSAPQFLRSSPAARRRPALPGAAPGWRSQRRRHRSAW
jgi:hypothetical protein